MKVAVVDDDIIFAKSFEKILKEKLKSNCETIDIYLSAESFLSNSKNYDILFLDIEMSGLSGLDLARKNRDKNAKIVFVTNRDDLVFEAYNTTGAIGFVRKFSIGTDLKVVIERLTKHLLQERYISVKSGDEISKIRYADIVYLEKMSHNVLIHTENDTHSKRATLSDLDAGLSKYGFVRTHIGYIANLAHIKLIKSNSVLLTNGECVPVSRSYHKQVKDKFLERSLRLYE